MGKSEVYSWRVAADLKAALEDAAREEWTGVGELLDRIARQWLGDRAAGASESEAGQRRVRASAARGSGCGRGHSLATRTSAHDAGVAMSHA